MGYGATPQKEKSKSSRTETLIFRTGAFFIAVRKDGRARKQYFLLDTLLIRKVVDDPSDISRIYIQNLQRNLFRHGFTAVDGGEGKLYHTGEGGVGVYGIIIIFALAVLDILEDVRMIKRFIFVFQLCKGERLGGSHRGDIAVIISQTGASAIKIFDIISGEGFQCYDIFCGRLGA